MYSDVKKNRTVPRTVAAAAVVAAVLILFLLLKDSGRDLSEESAAAIRETVRRSALQCYVVEGIYPPDLDYLTENYGLQINTDDFYVKYDAFASNLPPTVVVAPKR